MKFEVLIRPDGYISVSGIFQLDELGFSYKWNVQWLVFKPKIPADSKFRFGIFNGREIVWSASASGAIPYIEALLKHESYIAETRIPPERLGDGYISVLPNPIVQIVALDRKSIVMLTKSLEFLRSA